MRTRALAAPTPRASAGSASWAASASSRPSPPTSATGCAGSPDSSTRRRPHHRRGRRCRRTGRGPRPGDDFDAKTDWADVLEPEGWTRVYDHGQETAWRRPGKTSGISAVSNHLGTDTLKVFSTSTPIPTDGTHTRFGAYAWLHHGGDASYT
jgi:hypothetical protein